jgi:hypothetical protein
MDEHSSLFRRGIRVGEKKLENMTPGRVIIESHVSSQAEKAFPVQDVSRNGGHPAGIRDHPAGSI